MIFHKAVRKYGFDNFQYEVVFRELFESIEECKDKLNELEQYYIELYDSYRSGYNSTLGGDTIRGYKWSEQARKNHKRDYFPHTEETKQKISDTLKGHKQSDETKKKRSNTLYNMNKGMIIEQYSLDGQFIAEFPSAKRAAEILGLTSYANIHNVCKGIRKTAFGYIWKYKNTVFNEIK